MLHCRTLVMVMRVQLLLVMTSLAMLTLKLTGLRCSLMSGQMKCHFFSARKRLVLLVGIHLFSDEPWLIWWTNRIVVASVCVLLCDKKRAWKSSICVFTDGAFAADERSDKMKEDGPQCMTFRCRWRFMCAKSKFVSVVVTQILVCCC